LEEDYTAAPPLAFCLIALEAGGRARGESRAQTKEWPGGWGQTGAGAGRRKEEEKREERKKKYKERK